MGKDHWDAILASTPLNSTAGRVASGGQNFEPRAAIAPEYAWEGPPALAPITAALRGSQTFFDWTGKRVGRLSVLGLAAGFTKNDKGAMWACRCDCGRYVGRRTKGLRSERTDTAMCNQCNYTQHLRYVASGDFARKRAESEEARKW